MDTAPELGMERPLGVCDAGDSAVVVGSVTATARGNQPAGWVSTNGSSWANATFSPTPPAGSFTSVDGCLWTGNGFLAYGESTGSGQIEEPVLWSSSDGATWQEQPTTFTDVSGGSFSNGSLSNMGLQAAPLDGIALGPTTWLGLSGEGDLPTQVWPAPVGGSAGAQFTPAGLWSSVDAGSDWQEVSTNVPAFSGTTYAQVDAAAYVGQRPVLAGTVDGHLRVWVGSPVTSAPSSP
jgi:hypothetical protein